MNNGGCLYIKNVEEINILLPKWLRQIIIHHNIQSSIKLKLRQVVNDMEVDMILESARLSIGFELKDSDIIKAYEQAMKRRPFFDYFYIVINQPTGWIMDRLAEYHMAKDLVENGVGVVSSYDNVVILYSHRSEKTRKYMSILSFFDDGVKQ